MVETNRTKFYKKHNIPLSQSLSLEEIAKLSKMPLKDLNEVYRRGYGASRTNLKSVRLKTGEKNVFAPASRKMSPQQWGMGRVYSYVMKSPTTYYGSDKDIRAN